MFKKRKIVFPLVKSTTKFIMRCKGLLSLSTPLTVFQWTFHNSGHLDFTVSSLNCGISLLVEPRGKALLFPPTTLSDSIKGLWDGMGLWAEWCEGNAVWQTSPPGLPGPHTLAHLLRTPAPFSRSQEDLDKQQATVAIVFIQCLRWATASAQSRGTFMKGRNAEKTKITDLHLCF